MGCGLREVEGEVQLIRAEIIYIEDEFCRQVINGSPESPTNARVDLEKSSTMDSHY
jgi:hypothetical protein